MLRTHTCGELPIGHSGLEVTLTGWVHRRRMLDAPSAMDAHQLRELHLTWLAKAPQHVSPDET